MLCWVIIPETEGRVGKKRGSVKFSDSKAAPDIIHGRQRHVSLLHNPSLNETLAGAVTQSHQAVVVIKAEDKIKI